MYAVVHFEGEDSVECVPVSWLNKGKCYWPLKDAKKKIKNQSLPDKELWTKHSVRKLGHDYEDYETARKYCRKAEETSNIETDEEGGKRERKKPARYSGSESDADTENESDESESICVAKMPTPPSGYGSRLSGTPITTPSTRQNEPSPIPSQPRCPRSPSPPQQEQTQRPVRSPVKRRAVEQLFQPTRSPKSPCRSRLQPSSGKSPRTPSEQSVQPTRSSTLSYHRKQQSASQEKSPEYSTRLSQTPSKGRTPTYLEQVRRSPRTKARDGIAQLRTITQPEIHQKGESSIEINTELLQVVISKLQNLENDMKTVKEHLIITSDVDVDFIDSVLPSGEKLNSSDEIKQFEESMDESSRRKLINSLAALKGGSDSGEICRTVMRALLSNLAMSQYSGTGQKGKLPFIGTPLYKIILSAVRKASRKSIPYQDIKSEVLEVLRNAPNKPGGINYMKKKEHRRRTIDEDFPEDSS